MSVFALCCKSLKEEKENTLLVEVTVTKGYCTRQAKLNAQSIILIQTHNQYRSLCSGI